MSTSLPSQPNLDHLRRQAKALVRAHRVGDETACHRLLRSLPRFGGASVEEVRAASVSLQEAQHVLACEYGFRQWTALVQAVCGVPPPSIPPVRVPQPYRLRITTGEPGQEVEFTGTLIVRLAEPSYYAVTQQTPFELNVVTDWLSGTVVATTQDRRVQVELVEPRDGHLHPVLHGHGRHIVFGEISDPKNQPRFIWVF